MYLVIWLEWAAKHKQKELSQLTSKQMNYLVPGAWISELSREVAWTMSSERIPDVFVDPGPDDDLASNTVDQSNKRTFWDWVRSMDSDDFDEGDVKKLKQVTESMCMPTEEVNRHNHP
ncbi:hypothetical protein [Circoviridae 14 LDMD-2013]|uniref:hypothetical protein n=1 Tax=Circoviridae 14 LDMD-2013 TaxID=1379718 RepID=UPI00038468C0|nr:hypothetical protein [Circoviridae 14 LDMD-2013]AGS36221.1 hypothetical protein [Circoviridae 14 LDMD-2013]